MATSHWDCSDADLHAVTVQPLGVVPARTLTNDGLYGDGESERIQRRDKRTATSCLNAANFVANHVVEHSRVYDGMQRMTLRMRVDGGRPSRVWLLRCTDVLLTPLPLGSGPARGSFYG